MTRNEVVEQLNTQRREEHCFIKTWGVGSKFVDFDLIDRFIIKAGKDDEFAGFALFDIEEMWQTLIELDPDKLLRVKSGQGEVIEWEWQDSAGVVKKTIYPFSPEGIMTIIDDEFFA